MRDRLIRSAPFLFLTFGGLLIAGWVNYIQDHRVIRSHSSSAPNDLAFDRESMELTNTDRATIRSVIEQQLQAFQQNDAEKAFSFASPGIRAQFKTAEQFIAMVESSYRPLYRPRSVMFEDIVRVEGKVAQQVVVMGPGGGLFNAVYLMQLQSDYSWRIDGCFLTPIQGRSI